MAPGDPDATLSPRKTANLSIRFEYRPATLTDWPESEREGKTKPPTQKDLIAIAKRSRVWRWLTPSLPAGLRNLASRMLP